MAKAGQYYNGTDWQQFGLTTEDITLSNNVVATVFHTIKDKNDNLFITCFGGSGGYAKVIRLDKNGVNAVANMGNLHYSSPPPTSKTPIMLSRDNETLFCVDGGHGAVWTIPTDFEDGVTQSSNFQSSCEWYTANAIAAIYKDLYIWVASGATVKIYDYTTKAELASVALIGDWQGTTGITCSTDNTLYIIGRSTYYGLQINKFAFNGVNVLTKTDYTITNNIYTKQLLIDPFGDLIILTNSGTASTLLKYTTAGVQIGAAVTLDNPSYNLNIGKLKDDGSYKLYYQTALKTFSVNNTTAHAEIPALVNHVEIRGTGNTGYGSNYTGYQPSVYN